MTKKIIQKIESLQKEIENRMSTANSGDALELQVMATVLEAAKLVVAVSGDLKKVREAVEMIKRRMEEITGESWFRGFMEVTGILFDEDPTDGDEPDVGLEVVVFDREGRFITQNIFREKEVKDWDECTGDFYITKELVPENDAPLFIVNSWDIRDLEDGLYKVVGKITEEGDLVIEVGEKVEGEELNKIKRMLRDG